MSKKAETQTKVVAIAETATVSTMPTMSVLPGEVVQACITFLTTVDSMVAATMAMCHAMYAAGISPASIKADKNLQNDLAVLATFDFPAVALDSIGDKNIAGATEITACTTKQGTQLTKRGWQSLKSTRKLRLFAALERFYLREHKLEFKDGIMVTCTPKPKAVKGPDTIEPAPSIPANCAGFCLKVRELMLGDKQFAAEKWNVEALGYINKAIDLFAANDVVAKKLVTDLGNKHK